MSRRRQHGISLIEALVALAVLGFGMLAVVGVQATLRLSADTAKQRAEAVRIAQGAIEDGRAFSAMAGASAPAYAAVVSTAASAVAGLATNTTFAMTRTVADTADPRSKTLTVDVGWDDRTGQPQAVRLSTTIAGIDPTLAASLGIPAQAGPTSLPRGRHRAIPPAAVDMGDGTSRFTPPDSTGIVWVFNNQTAIITSICAPADTCVTANALLLTGFVRFAVGDPPVQPSGADAEVPPSTVPDAVRPVLQVRVALTSPTTDTLDCYEDRSLLTAIVFYCAVPVTSTSPFSWSGRIALADFPIVTASSANPTDRALHRVCRYTRVRNCQPLVGSTIWGEAAGAPNLAQTLSCTGSAPTPSRTMTNLDQPLDYAAVDTAVTNANFLVIRAGDGADATVGTAFDCPADATSTALVNGNTWRHQPE